MEQGVASDSAYPHWAWLQPQLANTSGADCVAAWSNYQYERFLGDASDSSHVGNASFYQTGSADRLFAWGAQPCAVRFATVCAVPASAFPCYPPPSPPPPPPQPPSPPTPPLQPSCAPRTSASFYCDAQFGMCYNYTGTAAFFSTAREACQAQGGDLVKLDSADKQLRVEKYFKRFGVLTGNMYWHGISRASKDEPLLFSADGTEVLPFAAEVPYTHWWVMPLAAASVPALGCPFRRRRRQARPLQCRRRAKLRGCVALAGRGKCRPSWAETSTARPHPGRRRTTSTWATKRPSPRPARPAT